MKINLKISKINDLRKQCLNEVFAASSLCNVEKSSHLLSVRPVYKSRKLSSEGVVLKLPRGKGFLFTATSQNPRKCGLVKSVTQTNSQTLLHADTPQVVGVTLRHALSSAGNHGIDSQLHTWKYQKGDFVKLRPLKIVMDYSSPNMAKPFHAGHLRSTLIGSFLAKLRSALGHTVTSINYFGDWGTQFGLLTSGYRRYGNDEELKRDPIIHLYNVYVKMNALYEESADLVEKDIRQACSDMERGEENTVALWEKFRHYSIENFERMYQKLGVKFDGHEFESQHNVSAQRMCRDLFSKGLLVERDGALVFPAEDQNSKDVVYLKGNGSSIYNSRDVAALIHRYNKYKFDKICYVTDSGQISHFSNVSKFVERFQMIPESVTHSDWFEHVGFGKITGMSTRKGTAVFLSDIIEEARLRMVDKLKSTTTTRAGDGEIDELAERLAISAVIVNDLARPRRRDYAFNWDLIINQAVDSGPFLQITHARLHSLFCNCGVDLNPEADTGQLTEPEAIKLIIHLARYDEVLRSCELTLEANVLIRYLFEMCHFVNSALKTLRVSGMKPKTAEARLLMFHCTRLTLANGLNLLGIEPLDTI